MEDLQDVKRKIEADAKKRTLNGDKKFQRVCLCVCENERERGRERERKRHRESAGVQGVFVSM